MKSSLLSISSFRLGDGNSAPSKTPGLGILHFQPYVVDLNIALLTIATLAKIPRNITSYILWLFKTQSFPHSINGVQA